MGKRKLLIILPAVLAIMAGVACAAAATATPAPNPNPATATSQPVPTPTELIPAEEPTNVSPTPAPTAEPTTAPPPANYLDNRSNPLAVMESFINALNRHEYLRAYSYWEDGAEKPSFDDFEQGYMATQSVDLTVGEITGSAGAGQRYYAVPVGLIATTTDNATQTFIGCYVLHLGLPSAQGVPPYQPLGINRADVQQVANDANTTDLLVHACDTLGEGGPVYATPTVTAPGDISADRYLDDRSGPLELVRSYFNAINSHQYLRAYSYWEPASDLPGFDEFQQGYTDTDSVMLETGTVVSDAGAGQLYYSVPVALTSTQTDGTMQIYVGCYQLHLANPAVQEMPPFQGLSIMRADPQPVAADADTAALLADACSTPSESGGSDSASAGQTVTLTDDGRTINVANGSDFLLKLGTDYNWTVSVDNPNIVSRVPNIMVVNGAQGVYQAHQAGSTILSATGTPVCPAGQICSNLALAFRVKIDVQ